MFQSCLFLFCFTYFSVIDFFVKVQVSSNCKMDPPRSHVLRNSVRYRRRVRSRRKLSGWHSFADRCLQDTATFNILPCNFRDHVPVRLLFIDGRVRRVREGGTVGASGWFLEHLSYAGIPMSSRGENKGCVFPRRVKVRVGETPVRTGASIESRRGATRWLNPRVYEHSDNRAPSSRYPPARFFPPSTSEDDLPVPSNSPPRYRVLDYLGSDSRCRSGLSTTIPRTSTSDAAVRVNSTM